MLSEWADLPQVRQHLTPTLCSFELVELYWVSLCQQSLVADSFGVVSDKLTQMDSATCPLMPSVSRNHSSTCCSQSPLCGRLSDAWKSEGGFSGQENGLGN